MASYCINSQAQSNGDHEVHNLSVGSNCLPAAHNRISLGEHPTWAFVIENRAIRGLLSTLLGEHPTCHSAVATARSRYPNDRANGCYYCANACHTS